MKYFCVAAFLVLLAACADTPPPAIAPSPRPDDAGAPAMNLPYRPVMAGTVAHGPGGRP